MLVAIAPHVMVLTLAIYLLRLFGLGMMTETAPLPMGIRMTRLQRLPLLAALAALSTPCLAAAPAQALAAQGQTAPGQTAQGQTAQGPPAASAPQGAAKVCIDAQTGDKLIEQFADRLRETIAASGALSLASTTDTCNLTLHVPGNLLRFQTAGGVMVSTVVIVTSSSGRYLSTSIAACQASDLRPCAVRAVAAAKLALLMSASDGA